MEFILFQFISVELHPISFLSSESIPNVYYGRRKAETRVGLKVNVLISSLITDSCLAIKFRNSLHVYLKISILNSTWFKTAAQIRGDLWLIPARHLRNRPWIPSGPSVYLYYHTGRPQLGRQRGPERIPAVRFYWVFTRPSNKTILLCKWNYVFLVLPHLFDLPASLSYNEHEISQMMLNIEKIVRKTTYWDKPGHCVKEVVLSHVKRPLQS